MYIKKVTLSNFKGFSGTHSFDFTKINLISGENGIGKSTISTYALLFALYGYSDVVLSEMVNDKTKKGDVSFVEIDLDYKGHSYIIKREIPTSVTLVIDGVEVKLANNVLKQSKIEEIFNNSDFFRKFRLLDLNNSLSLLDQTPQALRKTLVNLEQNVNLTGVRDLLQQEKHNREVYCKEGKLVYIHYPSQKRFDYLEYKRRDLSNQLDLIVKELKENEGIYYELNNKKSRAEANKLSLNQQKNAIVSTSTCPVCRQKIKVQVQTTIVGDVSEKIKEYNDKIAEFNDELTLQKEIIEQLDKSIHPLRKKLQNIDRLLTRLGGRIKQKNYIYNRSDVEIIKKCLLEIDGFSTFYITKKLNSLEPLINNILNKISFSVKFSVDKKNNFDIILNRNGQELKFRQLSTGLKLLVTIAFQLALLIEKGESGLIIADEGLSSLSAKNLPIVFDLFKNTNFQLIAIVHRFSAIDSSINEITLK